MGICTKCITYPTEQHKKAIKLKKVVSKSNKSTKQNKDENERKVLKCNYRNNSTG